VARLATVAMSPTFRVVVALLILRPGGRRAGLQALASGVLAAMVARLLRDRLARPRPGSDPGGGFPSRHAAAGVAIARAVGRHHPRAAGALWAGGVVGLAGRVVTSRHDPADLAAGALIGAGADVVVAGIAHRLSRAA
jgi:membrane-associated phospholipid phosphatase